MSGKGDDPRPMVISKEEFHENWDNISWKDEPEIVQPDIVSVEDLSNALSELHDKLFNNSKSMDVEDAKILYDNAFDLYE